MEHPSLRLSPHSFLAGRERTERVRGFTLIEMLLAVGVCSIVLLAINTAFFSALRLRNNTTIAVEQALPAQQTLTFLKRDLQCALTPNGAMSGDFKIGSITSLGTGETVSIEICTATGALRENEPWGDAQRVTYQLRAPANLNAAGRDLIRSVTRNLLATIAPIPESHRMMENVESLEITCYDGSQWLDTWDTSLSNTNLPNAVRVRIQMANAGGGNSLDRQPIEILVPISSQSRTNQFQTTAGAQ